MAPRCPMHASAPLPACLLLPALLWHKMCVPPRLLEGWKKWGRVGVLRVVRHTWPPCTVLEASRVKSRDQLDGVTSPTPHFKHCYQAVQRSTCIEGALRVRKVAVA